MIVKKKYHEVTLGADEVIEATKEKIDLLKRRKDSLMQKLLSPKPHWIQKRLGDVCTHFKGFAFESKDYISNGRRIVRVSDMGFDHIKDERNAIYISENKAELYKKWELKKDDLIITTVGSKPPVYDSLVGRTIVVQLKDENSLLNQNAVCLRTKDNIKQEYFNNLFKKQKYISFIESIIRGNANQGSITLEDLFEFQIFVPPTTEEQGQIASVLSTCDEEIKLYEQKLKTLEKQKKGLMQKLLTGKWRVQVN